MYRKIQKNQKKMIFPIEKHFLALNCSCGKGFHWYKAYSIYICLWYLVLGVCRWWQKCPKSVIFRILGDFEPFFHHLYSPDTEYHKQIYTEYALYQWNPLPHEQFRAKKCFSSGKIKFSDFFEFSYTFPIKMYGNRQGGLGGTKS